MTSLFKSSLRAVGSQSGSAARIVHSIRYASSETPSEAGPSASTTPPPPSFSTTITDNASTPPPRRPLFPNINLHPPPALNPNAWWKVASEARVGIPNNPCSGRSIPVPRYQDFNGTYRKIQRIIRNSGLREDIRRAEYYEKPAAKRVRLASERHRRRFAADVRDKVHLVQTLKARG